MTVTGVWNAFLISLGICGIVIISVIALTVLMAFIEMIINKEE